MGFLNYSLIDSPQVIPFLHILQKNFGYSDFSFLLSDDQKVSVPFKVTRSDFPYLFPFFIFPQVIGCFPFRRRSVLVPVPGPFSFFLWDLLPSFI